MAHKFQNISVLVIESSEATFNLVRILLMNFGINNVYPSYDFQKGFDIFKRKSPEIILVGALDNYDAVLAFTKRIRLGKESLDPLVPIILMIGAPSRGQVFTARDAGVSEFIIKPYTARNVFQKIESVIENPGSFVKAEDYFGPDRRHTKAGAFTGENRRTATPLIVDAKAARQLLKAHLLAKKDNEDK